MIAASSSLYTNYLLLRNIKGIGIINAIVLLCTNDSKEGKTLEVGQSEGMVQGIFMQYGITEDDDADGVRNGGFGSTTGK